MKHAENNDNPDNTAKRERQIRSLEKKFNIENLMGVIETLTTEYDIPVAEMSENMRHGVLLALLSEIATKENPAGVNELIETLLNMRRKLKGLPGKKANQDPVSRVITNTGVGTKTVEKNAENGVVGEDTVSNIAGGKWLTFDEEEWPSSVKDK